MAASQFFYFKMENCIEDTRALTSQVMETFDAQRIVFLKKSPKEKKLSKGFVGEFISEKNIHLLHNKTLTFCGIKLFVQPKSQKEAEDLIDTSRTKVYVGNLSYPIDNLILWNHFAQFGTLDYVHILKPPKKSGMKGFGFVKFINRESVERVLCQSTYLNGSKLNCKLFSNKPKPKASATQESESNECQEKEQLPKEKAKSGRKSKKNGSQSSNTLQAQDQAANISEEQGTSTSEKSHTEPSSKSKRNKLTKLQTSSPAWDSKSYVSNVSAPSLEKNACEQECPAKLNCTLNDCEKELPPVKSGVQNNFIYDNKCTHTDTTCDDLCLKEKGLQTLQLALKAKKECQEDFNHNDWSDNISTKVNNKAQPHLCGCPDVNCKECWCDLIDSSSSEYPCCFKDQPSRTCHEIGFNLMKPILEKSRPQDIMFDLIGSTCKDTSHDHHHMHYSKEAETNQPHSHYTGFCTKHGRFSDPLQHNQMHHIHSTDCYNLPQSHLRLHTDNIRQEKQRSGSKDPCDSCSFYSELKARLFKHSKHCNYQLFSQ